MRNAAHTLRTPLGAAVVTTVALATAACTAVCAIVDAALFRPPPFREADRLAVVIGPTGMNVILKLSSFLLVCIGVQIFWNGLSKLLASLLHPACFVVPL